MGYRLERPGSHRPPPIVRLPNCTYRCLHAFVDGLQLLKYVTANHPAVAVIMITAMNDARSAVEAMSIGAYDYVTKPFNIFELRSKIGRAAERRKLIQENKEYQSFLEERVHQQTADIKEALDRIEIAYSHTLEALISALDAREHETLRHSKRVSEYTLLIARALGIPSNRAGRYCSGIAVA